MNKTIVPTFGFAVFLSLANLHAQDGPPLQAELTLQAKNHRQGAVASATKLIDNGPATVRATLENRAKGETAVVRVDFRYRTKAEIALDEIIASIVVTTLDDQGQPYSTSTITPNAIHLNPNRVPLSYSATLYVPTSKSYSVKVQVYGNYE